MKTLIQTLFFCLLVTQICFSQWVQIGLGGKRIIDFTARDSNIFAISNYGEMFRSSDNGANWTMVIDSSAQDVVISPSGKVFMIKGGSGEWGDSLYSSLDNGETWTHINLEEQLLDSLQNVSLQSINISPTGIIFCGLHRGGCIGSLDALAKSTDDGLTWTTPGVGVIGGKLFDFRNQFVITDGDCHCVTTYCHYIYLSPDNGNTWNCLNLPVTDFPSSALSLFSNGNILIGQDLSYVGTGPFLLYFSENMGSTWTQISSLNCQSLIGLSWGNTISEGILIGTIEFGVLVYSDVGDSLGSWNEGLYTSGVLALGSDNNENVYLSELGNIMLWSGGIWRRPLSEIIPVELTSFTATSNSNEIILNWTTATETNNQGFEIHKKKSGVRSQESEWEKIGFVPGFGTTTETKSYSYTNSEVLAGKYIYRLKQIDFDGSFEYSPEVEVEVSAPLEFSLVQNYPNPFNPSTVIGYQLPVGSDVTIKVFDILGNEIVTLVDEYKPAGKCDVEFSANGESASGGNAINLPSGVYFYQLKAGEYTAVKKMILIK